MTSQRWLHGPVSDLVLGCGLGYAAIFLLQAFAGAELRALVPMGLMPLVLLVSGGPHYGATLLRVYEQRESRRAYAIFSVWITIALVLLFVAALHSALLGSWLLTIYLTWSPWHYTGQNYGIALMFLRRRGVPLTDGARRALYASFVLSFLLTVLAVHGATRVGSYAPSPYVSVGYRFMGLQIPVPLTNWGFAVFGAGYLLALLVAGALLLRRASLRDLAPTLVIVATQALWFSVPTVVQHADLLQAVVPLSGEYAPYAILWVAVGHAIQYLWVTSYYARRSGAAGGLVRYLLKACLAGAALWTLPALVLAPGVLGRIPFETGLQLLIATVVNLHHFILDGAIWKLRDGRVARVLIRGGEDEGAPPPTGPSRGPRLAPWVWGAGAVCVAVTAVGTVEYEFGVRRAFERGDVERLAQAAERLVWLGRDGPFARARLALLRVRAGHWEEGRQQIEQAVALHGTADAWTVRGSLYAQLGDSDEAIASYREALRMSAGFPEALNNLAWLLATHPDAAVRRPTEAVELAEQASRQPGASAFQVLDTLAAAYAAAGRFDDAVRTADRARRLATAEGRLEFAAEIEGRQRLFAAGRPYREPAPSSPGGPAETTTR